MTTFKIIGPIDESSSAQLYEFMKRASKRDREQNERYGDAIIAASKFLGDMKRASKKDSPEPEYGEE